MKRSHTSQWRSVVRRVTVAKMHKAGYTRAQLEDPEFRERVYTELVEGFTAPENVDYERAVEIVQGEVWRLVSEWNSGRRANR